MDEQFCSRILGDHRVLKHNTYKFTAESAVFAPSNSFLCRSLELAPGLHCTLTAVKLKATPYGCGCQGQMKENTNTLLSVLSQDFFNRPF